MFKRSSLPRCIVFQAFHPCGTTTDHIHTMPGKLIYVITALSHNATHQRSELSQTFVKFITSRLPFIHFMSPTSHKNPVSVGEPIAAGHYSSTPMSHSVYLCSSSSLSSSTITAAFNSSPPNTTAATPAAASTAMRRI